MMYTHTSVEKVVFPNLLCVWPESWQSRMSVHSQCHTENDSVWLFQGDTMKVFGLSYPDATDNWVDK